MSSQPLPSVDVSAGILRHLETQKTWVFEDDLLRAFCSPTSRRISVLAVLGKLGENGLVEIDVEPIGEDEAGPCRTLYRCKP